MDLSDLEGYFGIPVVVQLAAGVSIPEVRPGMKLEYAENKEAQPVPFPHVSQHGAEVSNLLAGAVIRRPKDEQSAAVDVIFTVPAVKPGSADGSWEVFGAAVASMRIDPKIIVAISKVEKAPALPSRIIT